MSDKSNFFKNLCCESFSKTCRTFITFTFRYLYSNYEYQKLIMFHFKIFAWRAQENYKDELLFA